LTLERGLQRRVTSSSSNTGLVFGHNYAPFVIYDFGLMLDKN
jgi:hypothetical protein